MGEIKPQIIKIRDLLNKDNLSIPEYQRPYKWNTDNVNQLLDDIIESSNGNKSAYRIGTIVIHKDQEILNIVDGQQRTVTFMLIASAILAEKKDDIDIHGTETLDQNYTPKSIIKFRNKVSKENVIANYNLLKRRVHELSSKTINYFFNSCEVVFIPIADITEAFQFFDSQNARGKDLDPHDLLKAYHLREMDQYFSEEEKRSVVQKWQSIKARDLRKIFGEYLYRIKQWSSGYSARKFNKSDIGIFKGMSPDIHENFPYAKIHRIANFYTDDYTRSIYNKINRDDFEYPFQIDNPIINGKRFFEMVYYYSEIVHNIEKKEGVFKKFELLKQLVEYSGAYNTGDSYVLSLFRTAVLYYFDKFGEESLEKAINIIFAWAYTLRFGLYSVGIKSIDNYALKREGKIEPKCALFKKIKEAGTPKQFLTIDVPVIKSTDSQFKYSVTRYADSPDGRKGLKTLLKERYYYE